MSSQAYALVFTFLGCSVLLGIVAVRLLALGLQPRGRAYVLPIVAAFLAFYLIGHQLGLAIGPEMDIYGFKVALVGDLVIGFAAALVVAALQRRLLRPPGTA